MPVDCRSQPSIVVRCGLPVLCVTALAIAACGGGGDGGSGSFGNSFANEIGNALTCGLFVAGCKASATLATADLSPDYQVRSDGSGAVVATAAFRTSGGFNHDVQLDASDQLSIRTDGAAASGFQDDWSRIEWSARFPAISASRAYRIDLLRAGGKVQSATIVVPPPFELLSPAGPLTLARSAAAATVVVSVPATERLVTEIQSRCTGAAVTQSLSLAPPSAAAGGSAYRVDPAVIATMVSPATGMPVSGCDVVLTLSRDAAGSFEPGFRADAIATGRFSRDLALHINPN